MKNIVKSNQPKYSLNTDGSIDVSCLSTGRYIAYAEKDGTMYATKKTYKHRSAAIRAMNKFLND